MVLSTFDINYLLKDFFIFKQVCVEQCPTRTILFEAQVTQADFEQFKPYMVCTTDINVQTMTYAQARQYFKEDKCASYVIQSQPGKLSF